MSVSNYSSVSAYKGDLKTEKNGAALPNTPPWISGRLSISYIYLCLDHCHTIESVRCPTRSMVAYLVACHRDMSVLTLPLNPDIYPTITCVLEASTKREGSVGPLLLHTTRRCHILFTTHVTLNW